MKLLVLALIAAGLTFAHDWQTGKVRDTGRSSHFAGLIRDGTGGGTAKYRTYQTFVIEGETHAYEVQQRLPAGRPLGTTRP